MGEKRFTELKGNVQKLNNSVKINDYGKCLDDFNDLTKNIDKAKKALDAVDNQLPTFVLSSMHKLDSAVVKAWPDRKKLNRAQGQALTKMKQRIKKYFEEPNKDIFKAQLEKYQENPVSSEKQETSESSESEDEPIATTARDILQNTKKKVTTKSRFEGMRRLSDSEDSDSESESESSSESGSSDSESSTEETSSDSDSKSESDSDSESDSIDWMKSDEDSSSDDQEGRGDSEFRLTDWKKFLKTDYKEKDTEKIRENKQKEKEARRLEA